MISCRGVSAGYGDKLVLHGVSVELEPGRLIGLLGPNGTGKSTLLRSLTRLLRPAHGAVRLDGRDLYDGYTEREAARHIALVSQEELQNFQHALIEEQELLERLRRHKAEDASAATEADADAALVPQDEMLQLRDALVQEQELVERLRRSKLELERRAVAAEAELDKASPARRKSIWARLLRRDGER